MLLCLGSGRSVPSLALRDIQTSSIAVSVLLNWLGLTRSPPENQKPGLLCSPWFSSVQPCVPSPLHSENVGKQGRKRTPRVQAQFNYRNLQVKGQAAVTFHSVLRNGALGPMKRPRALLRSEEMNLLSLAFSAITDFHQECFSRPPRHGRPSAAPRRGLHPSPCRCHRPQPACSSP